MEKQTLKQQLTEGHEAYTAYVLGLNERDFEFALPEKWNAGQHLQHILISVGRLAKVFDNPKYVIPVEEVGLKRDEMSYDAFVAGYLGAIKGVKASAPFVPEQVTIDQRPQLIKNVQEAVAELCMKLDAYTELQLDALTIPHPVLGRITLREMMYFTIYHAGHHYGLTKQYLQ